MAKVMSAFEKKSETATYCWTFEEFPKDKVTKTKRMFKTELCGYSNTWSLNVMFYNTLFRINLVHHGRSVINVTPLLIATLFKNNGPPIVYEKKLVCDQVDGDWEYYRFQIETDEKVRSATNEYKLKLDLSITYNVLERSTTTVLWDKQGSPSGPSNNLGELLKWYGESDLRIITKNDDIFDVLRDELTERSIGFYKMYAHEDCVDYDEVLRIDDVKAEAVHGMLCYLYTGSVEYIDDNIAEDMFVLIDRYDIPRLRIEYEKILVRRTRNENLAEMASLAVRFQLKELQKKVASLQP